MAKVNEKQAALTLGSFAALVHLVWTILVASGFAQGFADWIIGLHMISFQYTVSAFSAVNAILLIVTTFILGAIVGCVLATLWNKFSK